MLTTESAFDNLQIPPFPDETGGCATPSLKPRLAELSWRTVTHNTQAGVIMMNNQGWGANCNKPVTQGDWKELYLKWRRAVLDATTISALRDYAEEHSRMPELKPTPKFTWSFSALSDFENCPLSYAHKRYYKTYAVEETEAMRHGTRVHKALELYGLGEEQPETELDLIKNYTKYVDVMKTSGGKYYAECQVALTEKLKLTQWFAPDTWARGVFDVALKNGRKLSIYDWKGLALDTRLPTPSGWTTMGDVQEGDKVFGADGKPCTVIGKSQIKQIPCYELTFCDGSTIVCDEEHLWEVCLNTKDGVWSDVLPITEVAQLDVSGLFVRLSEPLQIETETPKLPMYTLGCWLGDGKHTDGSITKLDQGIFEEIEKEGFSVRPPQKAAEGKTPTRTVESLRTILAELGMLGNKHIPAWLLRTSFEERLALAQGLMDTDGSWNHARKQVVFTTVVGEFAKSVVELLCTLGQRPTLHHVKKNGFGKELMAWDVTFSPHRIVPFRTAVKRDKFFKSLPNYNPRPWRYIQSINAVPSVPTQCISVDSADSMYLCGENMIPTHNTGKPKEDLLQLQVFCAFAALAFPSVHEFDAKFIWLKNGTITGLPKTLRREDIKEIWSKLLPRVQRMKDAWDSEVWQAKPSGLCGWCPHGDNCKYRR